MNLIATAIRTPAQASATADAECILPAASVVLPPLTARGLEVLQILNEVFDSCPTSADDCVPFCEPEVGH